MNIGIFYFSGTGNTEIVAELFADNFKKNSHHVIMTKIEDITKNNIKLEIDKFDLIGIGHPVYGFGSPGIINTFIRVLSTSSKKNVFVFKTAGDFISINNGASKSLIKEIEKKGYTVIHESLTCMPSNWFFGYNDAFSKQLYETAIKKVKKYSTEILNGEKKIIKAGFIIRVNALITNFFEDNLGAKMFGRFLKVDKQCSNCNKCINQCTQSNIYRDKNNTIKFGWHCIWCMRCIYNCPTNAIKARHLGFCVLKNGYDIKKIINNSSIKGNFVNEKIKGFYKHFYKYLNEI